MRFRVSRDGQAESDKENDLWFSFAEAGDAPDVESFLTQTGGNEPEPTSRGFVKVYGGPNNGNWGFADDWDGAPNNRDLKIAITEPGVYDIFVAGRSEGYHIDWFELYRGGAPATNAPDSPFVSASAPEPEPEPQPAAPVASDDRATTAEDTVVEIDVLANDTDADSPTLALELLDEPEFGTAEIVNGLIRYTPDADANGIDSLTYRAVDAGGLASAPATVTVAVTPVNDAPVLTDQSVTIAENAGQFAVTLAASEFGSDPDGTQLYFFDVTGAENGEVTLAGEASILFYTPDNDFFGTETLTVTLWDQQDATVVSSAELTIEVTEEPEPEPQGERLVTAVNIGGGAYESSDGISYAADTISNARVYAKSAEIAGTEDDALFATEAWAKRGNLSYDIETGPGRVRVELDFAEIWEGASTPGVRVFDIALEGEVVEADVDIMAEVGFHTATTKVFELDVPDGVLDIDLIKGAQNPKLSALRVYTLGEEDPGTRRPPEVTDAAAGTDEDTALTVASSAFGADGLTIEEVSGALHGEVSVSANGFTLTYTPDPNFHGSEVLTLDLADPAAPGETAEAELAIAVAPVNDAPTARDDTATATAGETIRIDALANDFDLDGDALSLSIEEVRGGRAEVDGQQILFTADGPGPGEVTYVLHDPSGARDRATVDIAVSAADGSAYLDFFLADANTDRVLRPISDGEDLSSLEAGRHLTVLAEAKDGVSGIGSVIYEVNGRSQTENFTPYAVFGNIDEDLRPGPGAGLGEGEITIDVAIYSGPRGTGTLLETMEFDLTL